MRYLNQPVFDLGADSQADAAVSTESLQRKSKAIASRIESLGKPDLAARSSLQKDLADVLIDLNQSDNAWQVAFPALQYYLSEQNWQQAVSVCDTLFQSGHDDALIALGQGLWLSITFPVDPGLTLSMLQHVINETPEDSDGAAVAAAVGAYVADLRGSQQRNDDTSLAVGQMLNDVARRHGKVTNQAEFNAWFEKLELDDPAKFLVRMRNVIEVLVQDQWWFDRTELQKLIPQAG